MAAASCIIRCLHKTPVMPSSSPTFPSNTGSVAFALTAATIWLLMKGYHGLTGDAQIYAFQALARLHPPLSSDLYLQHTSQDDFTLFSPVYARFIGLIGLEPASRALTLLCTLWFLAAAWSIVRSFGEREAAWLAVVFLLIIAGDYGGAGVFRVVEPYLTARLPAQALTLSAIALQLRERSRLASCVAIAALLVHPLMALPGLLLLWCLRAPLIVSLAAAMATLAAAVGISVAAMALHAASGPLAIMDAPWLEVVRERSQFLFLDFWSFRDWQINALPFVSLGFTAIVIDQGRMRRLCAAAALVGAAGLSVALVAGAIGPVAIFLQGQAWRWVWIVVIISALCLPSTVLRLWREAPGGRLCALLLIAGWMVSAVQGVACISVAIALWAVRGAWPARAELFLKCAAAAILMAIAAWALWTSWSIISAALGSPSPRVAGSSAVLVREIFSQRIPAVALVAWVLWMIRPNGSAWGISSAFAALIALCIFTWPAAFQQAHVYGLSASRSEFAQWREAIPPQDTVLVVPARDAGSFVWFTLERPNYLALNQSAGVIFSRQTALEVARRSEVLLPVMSPNWKIRSSMRSPAPSDQTKPAPVPAMNLPNLKQICADPALGFVVSREEFGLEGLRHESPGSWKDWLLYDCRKLRAALT